MTTANDIGPVARKLIAAGRKQQRQEIVDLLTVRGARDEMRRRFAPRCVAVSGLTSEEAPLRQPWGAALARVCSDDFERQ